MQPQQTYIVDRILHWFSAGAILFLLFDMGTRIHNIDYRIKGAVQHKQDAIELHMTIAFVLGLVLLMRLFWYHFFLHPNYRLKYGSTKHKWLVRIVHTVMYSCLFLLMLSGLFMVLNYQHPINFYGWLYLSEVNIDKSTFYRANDWHLYFESTIYFLIFVHIAGAIYNRR